MRSPSYSDPSQLILGHETETIFSEAFVAAAVEYELLKTLQVPMKIQQPL